MIRFDRHPFRMHERPETLNEALKAREAEEAQPQQPRRPRRTAREEAHSLYLLSVQPAA